MSVEERMIKIVSDVLGIEPDKITMESNFVKDLGVESLDTVEIVAASEVEFGIEIPMEDAEKNTTVGKAVEYIKKKLEEKEKGG